MKTILTPEQNLQLLELGVEAKSMTYLVDLLSILPKKITDRKTVHFLEMGAWNTAENGWYIKYVNDMDNDPLESYQESEELIDAIYLTLCWLKSEDNQHLVWL